MLQFQFTTLTQRFITQLGEEHIHAFHIDA